MTKPNVKTHDYSTHEGGRECLRMLIVFLIILAVLFLISSLFFSIPEGVQLALELEAELQPGWKTGLEGGGTLVLLVLLIWACVDLWRFRKEGIPKLAAVVFMPYFMIQFSSTVSPPFGNYLEGLSQLVTGMILFLCWTRPEIFLVSKVPPPVPPL